MTRLKVLAIFSPVVLTACVGGPAPDIATPPPDLPSAFATIDRVATGGKVETLLPLNDPAFIVLSDAAVDGAPTLLEAVARIEQARANAERAGAERLPAIGADAGVTATRTNPAQFSNSLPPNITFDTERVAYAANLTARWDPDLFGVLRAQERAAIARIGAAEAGAVAVRLALIGEIAASVIDWRTLNARAEALQDDLDAANAIARLAGVREEAGLSAGFDRVRAEAAAAASRTRLAALESERSRLLGRLVTLTALPAQQVLSVLDEIAPANALTDPPTAVPSLVLVNRPDIARAEAELAASDAELAATARTRFPRLDLSAAIGLLAFSPGDLFDEDSIVGSLAAGIAAPLFDFGRIEAEIDAAAAGKRIAFQNYRDAVFTALGDVEAAYGLIAAADREAHAAVEEREQTERAARLADTRYRAGLSDFLTVLEARRSADASGERAAAAFGRARRARVLLWQALGGSVEPEEAVVN